MKRGILRPSARALALCASALCVGTLGLLTVASSAEAAPGGTVRVAMRGELPTIPSDVTRLGPLPGTEILHLDVGLTGQDPAGRRLTAVRLPTLVADGTLDQLNPVANDRTLAGQVPGAKLILYPGAGHAFLFQDMSTFLPAVQRFLG